MTDASRVLRSAVRQPSIRRACVLLSSAIFLCFPLRTDAQPTTSREPIGWRLVWSDEFDRASIDTTKWGFDLGAGFSTDGGKTVVTGWGNNELQCYTRDSANVFVSQGALHLRAHPSQLDGCAYTSARVKTRGADGRALFAARYGRFEFRAKLPTGRGLWPALWMLPLDDVYGTWAASGEIDVMEARGQTPTTVLGTLHYGSRWPHNTHSGMDYVLPRGGTIEDFHTYAVEWDPGRIRWYVDGVLAQTQSFWWSSGRQAGGQGAEPARASDVHPWPAPFDQRFYLVMNLAVGGNFLGNPDATTRFPGEMIVDFVRVYERSGGPGRLRPRGAGRVPFSRR